MVISCKARRPTACSTGNNCSAGASRPASASRPSVQVRDLALAGPAEAAILGRIGFPAQGADDYPAPVALAEKLGPDLDLPPPQDFRPGLPDFLQQAGRCPAPFWV